MPRDAAIGNGVMIAPNVESREKVDRVHKKALELHAQTKARSAPRSGDLDSNKQTAG